MRSSRADEIRTIEEGDFLAEPPFGHLADADADAAAVTAVIDGEATALPPKGWRGSSPVGFFLFSLVGASGVLVQFAALWLTHEWLDFNFTNSQIVATLVAMTSNFILNNELTYGERSLRGRWWWSGLMSFYAVCSIGAIANIAVAVWVYQIYQNLWIASLIGVAVSVAFNYTLTRLFTWQ